MQEPPSGDELAAALARWAADERAASAAAARSRERSLREQAGASATWAGILVNLAEQGAAIVAVISGRRWSGRIVGVGRDFCVLESGLGRTAIVRLDAVSVLWPDVNTAADLPAGDRGGAIDLSLVTVLALLAEDRCPIGLVTTAGLETVGDLIAAGEDVLTLRTDPPARRLAHVPLHAVALCELR